MKLTMSRIIIFTQNMEAMTAFYRDVIGLPFLFQAPPGMSFFDCGGVRLMIGNAAASGPNPPRSMLYYRVVDIQAAAQRLAAHGVDTGKGPVMIAKMGNTEIWLLEFEDSEGNAVALMQERAG